MIAADDDIEVNAVKRVCRQGRGSLMMIVMMMR